MSSSVATAPAASPTSASAPQGARAHGEIVGLNVIRFLAAGLVMNCHLAFYSFVQLGTPLPSFIRGVAPLTWFGFAGVEIFFVLSGFVIAYSASNASASVFIRRRIVRIYPTVWVCALATFGILYLLHSASNEELRHSLILFGQVPPFMAGSYWTLPIELSFYAFIAALLLIRRSRWLEPAMILLGLYSLAINVGTFWTLQHPTASVWAHRIQARYFIWHYYLLLAPFGIFFALGALLWLCSHHGYTPRRLVFLFLFLGGGIVGMIIQARTLLERINYSASAVLAVAAWLTGILLIVLSVRFNDSIRTFVGPRGVRYIRILGLATFPLYLLHERLGFILSQALAPTLGLPWALLVTEAAALAVSFAFVLWIEPPLNRVFTRLLGLQPRERAGSISRPQTTPDQAA